ncbi:hypothetical protein OSB04_024247 [Centaurea solstitialis]|uniref:Uncharacterized protein n=1 Tax=Centaurea solstitialis TaxID=347529 RepID=A0AA38SY29_9ASTR|nr:hypothetical protein OSB04_024247 [Centaurea solstitialis]
MPPERAFQSHILEGAVEAVAPKRKWRKLLGSIDTRLMEENMLDIRKYLFRLKDDDKEVFRAGISYLSTIGALLRWLPLDHHWRTDVTSFVGREELRVAPTPLSGEEVFHQLDGTEFLADNDQDQEMNEFVLQSTDLDQ